ncbi:hypothetical protein [Elioraea sp.]|uniref:hypothetical protein n=1 Tax=Elioraea sp. TaxID=2185103 RepID=UPI003F6F55F2
MTIVAIWQEGAFLWTAADTRIVTGSGNVKTDSGSKIFSIPIICFQPDSEGFFRIPSYNTTYGFAFAGSVLPASMTAITAATLLSALIPTSESRAPPCFEHIAVLFERLAGRFMQEHYRAHSIPDALFSAALFGWCGYERIFKVAHISGHNGRYNAEVALTYTSPRHDTEPWLVLGSGKIDFDYELRELQSSKEPSAGRLPLRAIERMIGKGKLDIGGAISVGITTCSGFRPFLRVAPRKSGKSEAGRFYNGIDVDNELGLIGHYCVGNAGIA